MSFSPRAYLFDFDLTLADSSDAICFCATAALGDMGQAVPPRERIEDSIGLTLEQTFAFLTGNQDAALAASYRSRFVAHADRVMVGMTRFYPDAVALLAELHARRIPVAIVSTKYRYRIEQILRHLDLAQLVTVIVGHEDVGRHKPDPEGLLKALDLLGVKADEAIYVGDHTADQQAAAAAGTRFVGAVTGKISSAQWRERGCRAIERELGEVLGMGAEG
ncbi:HAD family hydrolase [Burkholderia gladioli]|uniref:HAD family hydrolase n=1 Tax=Burkholderia gladioli TaxID=28095 RepID=UPI00163FC443|nr:HAD family hydrolase [Burkholderia gladioli]